MSTLGSDANNTNHSPSRCRYIAMGVANRLKLQGAVRPRRADTTVAMLRKTAKALNKPGINNLSIFTNKSAGIFAYSADPLDATKLVRTSPKATHKSRVR
jgi:hypothetical protein